MDNSRENKINPSSLLCNMLTLRYDPTSMPILQKKIPSELGNNDNPSLETIEKIIEKSIKSQLHEQKKISIALSGGVDSTLILMYLRKCLPDAEIHAISIRFARSIDETQSAAKIAKHFDAKHHIVEVDNYLVEFPKAISITKLPLWDLHWYHVVKKASTICGTLLSGDGGDEVFGGYTFRYKKFLSLTNVHSTPLEKVKTYLECHERDHVPDQDKIFGEKANFSWKSIYDLLIRYFDNQLSNIDQVLLADYNGKLLYNFSLVNNALHNHFGLKSVAPLLTNELITYVSSINNRFKYDSEKNVGKLLLRQLLAKHKADFLVNEEKLGFNVNTMNLWKYHGYRLCKSFLSDSRMVADGWINPNWVDTYIDKTDLDVRYINKFLGLLAAELWYRLFITKELEPDKMLN